MNTTSLDIGIAGQNAAERFLKTKGYRPLARNWRVKQGEVDLVCKTSGALAFVEVKTLRAPQIPFSPENHFSYAKQKKLITLAALFMQMHKTLGEYQIDLVAVELDQNLLPQNIRHYPRVIGN